MQNCSTKGEARMAASLPSLQKKLLLGIIFGNPVCVHFCALPCLESFLLKLWAWQFCDVALSKFVTLIIPAKKNVEQRKKKALSFETQQQPWGKWHFDHLSEDFE